MMKTKVCSKCKKRKSISSFWKNKFCKDGFATWCKVCTNAGKRKYYQRHPQVQKNIDRKKNLKLRYNMTLNDYNNLLKKQAYCCAICGRHQSKFKRKLSVDYNHKTGQVRGLLCQSCNKYIGLFEQEGYLIKAKIYLKGDGYEF